MRLKDASLLLKQLCYINGQWSASDSGATINVTNPATGKVIGFIPKMGSRETGRAIESANAAWPAWRAKTANERAVILRRWFDLLMENQEDLAIIMTAEQGKPLLNPVVKSPMPPRLSSGLPKRVSGSMVTSSLPMLVTNGTGGERPVYCL